MRLDSYLKWVCKYHWSYFYWALYCNLTIVMIKKYLKGDKYWSIVWIFAMAANFSYFVNKKIVISMLNCYCREHYTVKKLKYRIHEVMSTEWLTSLSTSIKLKYCAIKRISHYSIDAPGQLLKNMSFNTKLIHIQIIFMHTFLCFDLWTPTASAHVANVIVLCMSVWKALESLCCIVIKCTDFK
jgi:hypothetical protein